MTETVFDNIDPAVLERVKQLRLIDDELMTVVFSGDKKAAEFLIRILLNRNDLTVTKSMTQVQKHNLFGRSVKLDVVAEDIFKTEYNIEIQRDGSGAGGRRIRYHQAMIDSHTLKKQEDFINKYEDTKIYVKKNDSYLYILPEEEAYDYLIDFDLYSIILPNNNKKSKNDPDFIRWNTLNDFIKDCEDGKVDYRKLIYES